MIDISRFLTQSAPDLGFVLGYDLYCERKKRRGELGFTLSKVSFAINNAVNIKLT